MYFKVIKLSLCGIALTHFTHYFVHWLVHRNWCPFFIRKYHDIHHRNYATEFLKPYGKYQGGDGYVYIIFLTPAIAVMSVYSNETRFVIIVSLSHMYLLDKIHTEYHTKNSILQKFRLFKYLQNYHKTHHQKPKNNISSYGMLNFLDKEN